MWLREVDSDQRGRVSIVALQGYIQVEDLVGWYAADHKSMFWAGRISGASFLRFLVRDLSNGRFDYSMDIILLEEFNVVHSGVV